MTSHCSKGILVVCYIIQFFSGHCQHASGMAACTLFVYVLHVAELRAAYQHGKVSS
jgi:hypothetical protein